MNKMAPAICALSFASLERGVLKITGADRIDLLHRLSTQDIKGQNAPGRVTQTLFTTAQGKTLVWAQLFYCADSLLLVCPLARLARLAQWIDTYTIMEELSVADVTDDWVYFQALGDSAAQCLGLASAPSASQWLGYAQSAAPVGHVTCVAAALGAGVCGLMPRAVWPFVHSELLRAGGCVADAKLRQQQRLLAGIPSSHYELHTEPNPLEMRLGPSCISWNKGCYIGQEVISRLDSYDKVARLLMGFVSPQVLGQAGEPGQKLFANGRPIGRITSSVATAKGSIGLALVKCSAAVPGPAQLQIDGAHIVIELVDRPFWDKRSA